MNTKIRIRFTIILILLLSLSLSTASSSAQNPAQTLAGTTERVSIASDGTQGNDNSGEVWRSSISPDGRYVAFHSYASNLVAGDSNGTQDVFVHDRVTGETTRVSVASNGRQGNRRSWFPSISSDGRYVAFESRATNLVAGDTNGAWDVFVHDQVTVETTRVSVASNGTQGNGDSEATSISSDGRYVAFYSHASNLVVGDTNGADDVFVHDRQTGETTLVSVASNGTQGNGYSAWASISSDGRYVAFESVASNLVNGDINGKWDIFVHDRQTGETTLVSVASNGTQGNDHSSRASISADGRHVAFHSMASNLVDGDTNGTWDVFVHDRQTGETTRASVASDGAQGNYESTEASISSDGSYIGFYSVATNLVVSDTNGVSDIFVHDQQTGETTRVSIASDGTQGDGNSSYSCISGDGRFVTFGSYATNLVSGDTNGFMDVFVHERGSVGTTYTISGRIIDTDGNPIPDVIVSASPLYSGVTDIQGYYIISDVITGTYTVTPTLIAYTFAPPSLTVSVPPDSVEQNFLGYMMQYIFLPFIGLH